MKHSELEFYKNLIEEAERISCFMARIIEGHGTNCEFNKDLTEEERAKADVFLIILQNLHLSTWNVELFKDLLDNPFNFYKFNNLPKHIKKQELQELDNIKKITGKYLENFT